MVRRSVAAVETALAARRAFQYGHGDGGDAVPLHLDVAERRERSGDPVGLEFARADVLAQDSAAALDRRKLGGVEIERHLRDRRDRDRLDLDVANVAGRPAGGDGCANDQGADRKTKTAAHGCAPALRSHAPGGLMPPISLLS